MATALNTHVEADFSLIRYAQCWEDADLLLEAMDVQPGDRCLSIASAGDNTLALLTRSPGQVIALDLSQAQLACLELRVAAYRELSHPELLELLGLECSNRRPSLYRRCRSQLSAPTRRFWDGHGREIDSGIGQAGKFERYLRLFREHVLPLIHSHRRVARLLKGGTAAERQAFYDREWNTWRWRWFFRLFFSRLVMGRLGRDPAFFEYVRGSVAERLLERTQHALTVLDPRQNPYLQWILMGEHTPALPCALRPENFDLVRRNLPCLEWRCQSVEDFLHTQEGRTFDGFNLSDIFEYMPEEHYHRLLERLVAAGRPGARLVYWNMLAHRQRPSAMAGRLRSLAELSSQLHRRDKAFFYSALVVEEVC